MNIPVKVRIDASDMETLLGRLKQLEQQNDLLRGQVETLLSNQESQRKKLEELVAGLYSEVKNLSKKVSAPVAAPQVEAGRNEVTKPAGQQVPPPPAPAKRTVYCRGESSTLVIEVPDNYADKVPFVIEALGEKGVARFNPRSIDFLISQPESGLEPYFECAKTTSNPTYVNTDDKVNVTYNGTEWILERPLKITLS